MIDFVTAPASLPPNQRVYAIGDVHGCLDRLAAMHALIAADLAERPVREPLLVHLGDYVDGAPTAPALWGSLPGGWPCRTCRPST